MSMFTVNLSNELLAYRRLSQKKSQHRLLLQNCLSFASISTFMILKKCGLSAIPCTFGLCFLAVATLSF